MTYYIVAIAIAENTRYLVTACNSRCVLVLERLTLDID